MFFGSQSYGALLGHRSGSTRRFGWVLNLVTSLWMRIVYPKWSLSNWRSIHENTSLNRFSQIAPGKKTEAPVLIYCSHIVRMELACTGECKYYDLSWILSEKDEIGTDQGPQPSTHTQATCSDTPYDVTRSPVFCIGGFSLFQGLSRLVNHFDDAWCV